MPLILGTNSIKDTGYDVANSCRFNDGDSPKMSKDATSGTNITVATISLWCKRGALATDVIIFSGNYKTNVNYYCFLKFRSDDKLMFTNYDAGTNCEYQTNRLFRDPSAWYHICVRCDLGEDEDDRVKIYVNGVQETSFSTETAMTGDQFFLGKSGYEINVSNREDASYFDGYLAEVVYIDGTSYAPTSFGEFDEDSPTIWKPIDVSGLTFGTNGFYLDFEASDNLGNDANGGTDLDETNLAAADQATDTPTNNFATWNPLNVPTSNAPVFDEGNVNLASAADAAEFTGTSTIGVTNGKWYAEFKNTAGSYCIVGITSNPGEDARNNVRPGTYTTSWGYNASGSGEVQNNNSGITYTCDSWTTNDIIGVYIDCDNSKLYFAKNGTVQNSGTGISLVSGDTYFFTQGDGDNSSGSTHAANFGGCPAFAVSSAVADTNSYGSFEYDPSAGTFDSASKDFLALCTKNLGSDGG